MTKTMTSEEKYFFNAVNTFINDIRGSCKDIMSNIDVFIDNGYFTQEWFDANEKAFLYCVDNAVFVCDDCGWVCEIGEMSSQGQICDQCIEDEEENDND